MNKTIISFFLIAVVNMWPAYGQNDEFRELIEKIIRYETNIKPNPHRAIFVGVVDGDSVMYSSHGLALTEKNVFEIGSCSKVITASLLSILHWKNMIKLDTSINAYIPEEFRNESFGHITLIDLINHRTGLPRLPEYFGLKQKAIYDPYAEYSKIDLLKYYKRSQHRSNGASFSYSHIHYALLEIMIEYATGRSYDEVLREHLLYPLEMFNSFSQFKDKENWTQGFDLALRPVIPRSYASFSASEGIKSTAADLLQYLKILLSIEVNEISYPLISALRPRVVTDYDKNTSVGHGWHIVNNLGRYPVFMHTGRTSGHQCFIAFIKETKTAVVVLTNSSAGSEDLGVHILRTINNNWKKRQEYVRREK